MERFNYKYSIYVDLKVIYIQQLMRLIELSSVLGIACDFKSNIRALMQMLENM